MQSATSTAAGTALERAALALFEQALDVDAPARDAWLAGRCGSDERLRSRVQALLRADAGGDVRLPDAPLAGIPERIGPYRLDALIGSGGMGSVYRARRDDGLFEQTVAIKFVRPLGERAPVQALIDAERRTLARMNHPGIARILDGGSTANGLHYLVMEFVHGEPIDAFVQRHALDARARIALLCQVCDAVADAHRHLVLHCDLKPANILVDADGHAKLIDFGIARLRDVADPTLPHGFTHSHASPQRLAGEAPTVADDVYALGMLLAELLGGVLPSDATQVMPRGALDAELAAVARRALAEAPQERYAGADAVRAELQRWLDRRAVEAMPPHWRYRAAKLMQRHPWRVAGGAGALAGLLVALAVIATLYTRADAARREAEQRFGELRALARYTLFELDAKLEATPGTTAIRRELVERSQHYLDVLARTAGNDAELQREAAVGLGRLAEIEGGWAVPNTGERTAARPTFERAEHMLDALVQQRPTEWRWQHDLGRVQQRLAAYYGGVDNDARKQLAKAQESEAHLHRAVELAQATHAAPDDLAALQTTLSATRVMQAFARDWLDDSRGAMALAAEEEQRLLALPEAVQHAMGIDAPLGRAANQGGDSLFFLERYGEALAAYRRAQQRYALALQAHPNDRRLIDNLAVSRWSSSLTLNELGRPAEALVDNDLAMDQAGRLLMLDPGNDNAQRLMLILRSSRTAVLGRLGRYDEAVALARQVIEQRRERARQAPDISEPARDAVVPLHALADLYRAKGDTAAACAASREAIAAWAQYAQRWGLTELDRKQNEKRQREAVQRCSAGVLTP